MWTKRRAFLAPQWAISNANAPADWLDSRYFPIAIGVALALHLIALTLWELMPPMQVVQIPVRALDIKLGNGDVAPAEPKPAPAPVVTHAPPAPVMHHETRHEEKPVERAPVAAPPKSKAEIEQNVTHATSHSREKVVGKFDVRMEKSAVAAPVMPVVAHQFVRELGAPAKGAATAGSNQAQASSAASYVQALSLWLQKFKVYPEAARTAGIQGDAVVRIRIDRRGNIGYYVLEKSSGSPVLDRAAVEMIKNANPVPPVPANYPGDSFDFTVPVNFQLDFTAK